MDAFRIAVVLGAVDLHGAFGSVCWQNGSWFYGNLTEGRTFSSFGRGATSKQFIINTNLHLACFLGEDPSSKAKAEGYLGTAVRSTC